jgi:hypothetical protein
VVVTFQKVLRLVTVKSGKSVLLGKFTDKHKKVIKHITAVRKVLSNLEPFIPVILLQ